jgi:hypothetical protein
VQAIVQKYKKIIGTLFIKVNDSDAKIYEGWLKPPTPRPFLLQKA